MEHKHICCFPVLIVIFFCIGLMLGVNASAEGKDACTEDIAKFCKDVKPGHGSVRECLEKHETELTDACKDYEQKMEGDRMERREFVRAQIRLHQACKDEVAQFCKDRKPGTSEAECLSGNENKLSATCREAHQAAKEEEKKSD